MAAGSGLKPSYIPQTEIYAKRLSQKLKKKPIKQQSEFSLMDCLMRMLKCHL